MGNSVLLPWSAVGIRKEHYGILDIPEFGSTLEARNAPSTICTPTAARCGHGGNKRSVSSLSP